MRRLSLPLAALLVVPLLGSDAPRGYDGATVTDRLEEAWSEAVSFSLCPAAVPGTFIFSKKEVSTSPDSPFSDQNLLVQRGHAMNHLRSLPGLFCACALVIGPCGCDAGPKRYGVSGEVRYKGKPLDHGGIIFLPESPTAGADSGGDNIKNGKYAIPAKKGLLPGRYKVLITSVDPNAKETDPDAPPGPAGPLPKDRVAAKYNDQTILTAEVTADGPNKFDFDVD